MACNNNAEVCCWDICCTIISECLREGRPAQKPNYFQPTHTTEIAKSPFFVPIIESVVMTCMPCFILSTLSFIFPFSRPLPQVLCCYKCLLGKWRSTSAILSTLVSTTHVLSLSSFIIQQGYLAGGCVPPVQDHFGGKHLRRRLFTRLESLNIFEK